MTERVAASSPRLKARTAGAFYLLTIVAGVLYSLFVLATMPSAWAFYLFLGSVDILLTSLVVWYAWNWPRREATEPG